MKELIRVISQALVDTPEQVSVEEVYGTHTMVYELKVGKGDLGKVIGKKGRNADAIRTIVNAVAAKESKRALVEIIDNASMVEPIVMDRVVRTKESRRFFAVKK
jgi:predicted RNA-binding protein YlqC (UPF0109 family)